MTTTQHARVFMHGTPVGTLVSHDGQYVFTYDPGYSGPPVSLTLPIRPEPYRFDHFPSFFDGLLPEGWLLELLLRKKKLDRHDYLGQLLAVGRDLVGAVTVRPLAEAVHD